MLAFLLRYPLSRLFVLILAMLMGAPAQAAVTITFWARDLGNSFPHAFFTVRGTLDADGTPVDATYGFTTIAISPAILFGTVPGRLDETSKRYIMKSNAQFATVISDAQYAQVMLLAREWGPEGNSRYNMNRRNCVHFVAEAARRSGLVAEEDPKLMKKPRSFLQAVAAANEGRVLLLGQSAADYFRAHPDQEVTGGNGAPDPVLDREIDRSRAPADVAEPVPAG